jgi:uncharacterized protein (DUF697 family)
MGTPLMNLSSGPLIAFLEALEIPPAAVETADELTVSAIVPGHAAKSVAYEVVEQLHGAYGRALTGELQLSGFTEWTIGGEISPERLAAIQATLLEANPYELKLTIKKRALVDCVLGTELATCTRYYFFATSLENLAIRGLHELEEAVWGHDIRRLRLLVGDTTLRRKGPALEILGGAHLTESTGPLSALSPPVTDLIERMRSGREQLIGWDHRWVEQLTPVQLQLDDELGSSRLEALLASAYVQLCLLYTCDRARRIPRLDLQHQDEYDLVAEYQGGQLAVRVPMHEVEPLDAITASTSTALARLINWCYQPPEEGAARDWAPDRLQFAQVRIAQVLDPLPQAERLAGLLRRSSDIVAGLDGQWRSFVEDKLGQYLDKERQLETIVNDVVGTFGEQCVTLTKGLGDTMLAAIAALIGSAIAAAFVTPFNSALFRVGVLAYAGYVLVFPGIYGLSSQVGQYLDAKRSFEHEKADFQVLIGPERVEAIIRDRATGRDRVSRAQSRYWRWFGFTTTGYALAIAAGGVAALVVPSIVTAHA